MSASIVGTRRSWGGSIDEEGYCTLWIRQLVKTTRYEDGPVTVMNTPGLAQPGSIWQYGNDLHPWVYCLPSLKVSIHDEVEGDPNRYWIVESTFANKPMKRCNDTKIEDPLQEPQKVSGSYAKYQKEISIDRNGKLLQSSSHELFRGELATFEASRPNVRIEQNVATLGLETFSQMIDHVNDDTLWGLGARKIKLSNISWVRNVYGTCGYYYTRTFDFDINFDTFDRDIPDQGTKVLNGGWDNRETVNGSPNSNYGFFVVKGIPRMVGGVKTLVDPDPDNPQDFVRYRDRYGEPSPVLLNGAGLPANTDVVDEIGTSGITFPHSIDSLATGDVCVFHYEYYPEANFLELGIPTSF